MSAILTLAIWGGLVGGLAFVIFRWLDLIRFTSKFNNAGFPLPLLGNAHVLFNVPPEGILPVLKGFAFNDPKKRKLALTLGHTKMILLFHPETVEPVLKSTVHTSKSNEYHPLLCWLGEGLLLSSGEKWRSRRKLLTPAFHFKILEDAMRTFNRNADTLADILERENGKTIDLFPFVIRCTLDIILEAAMGKSLDIQNGKNSQYDKSIGSMLHIVQTRQRKPWLMSDALFNVTALGSENAKMLEILHGFTRSVIAEKRREIQEDGFDASNKRTAFLDLLLNTKTEDGRPLTDMDIQEEVDTFMFEGHDTTGCALSWALLLLGNHPEIQQKCFEEQKDIFGDDLDAEVTNDHLSKMKFLDCCIKEALRLYPSVPMFGRTIQEDLHIDGEVIEKGSTASILVAVLHRNPEIWDEPDKFVPERFMGGSEGIDRAKHPYSYVPFSAGPRNCIGMRFAQMEEKTVLSKLIRRFHIEPVDKVEDVKPVVEVITRPHAGIHSKFISR